MTEYLDDDYVEHVEHDEQDAPRRRRLPSNRDTDDLKAAFGVRSLRRQLADAIGLPLPEDIR